MGAYSITQIKILQTRKTREINLFNAVPKTFKDALLHSAGPTSRDWGLVLAGGKGGESGRKGRGGISPKVDVCRIYTLLYVIDL